MSNEQPHDPTITLRLELGRVTDQRDAFKAALTTEVMKVAKVAIIQAAIDAEKSSDADMLGCMAVELDDLRKENASLRERTDNLVIKNNERHAELARLEAENARLKAEVERLTDAITAGAITPDAREVQS